MEAKINNNNAFTKIRESFIAEFADVFSKVVDEIRTTPSHISELGKYEDVDYEKMNIAPFKSNPYKKTIIV